MRRSASEAIDNFPDACRSKNLRRTCAQQAGLDHPSAVIQPLEVGVVVGMQHSGYAGQMLRGCSAQPSGLWW
jgi:hypothetical protein